MKRILFVLPLFVALMLHAEEAGVHRFANYNIRYVNASNGDTGEKLWDSYEELRQDLLRCLSGTGQGDTALPDLAEKPGILQLLSSAGIIFGEDVFSWTDAVYRAGAPLVENGSISERYLDTIINQTTYYGSYMFITNEIMLAHAKPENGVNRLGLSLGVFRRPVPFPGGRQARLIFVLAAEDNERHFRVLNELLETAQDEDFVSQLVSAENENDVINCLRSRLL